MQLNLTAEEEAFIDEKLAEGYESRESVIAAALALMRESEREYAAWLREQVEVGLRQIEVGDVLEFESDEALLDYIESRGRERLAQSRREAS
ncbi:MAG: type II toxin-antitoxin system ParD family antitoxin [Dehalococcoidia bacterium]